jgi:hypothetical protein
VSIKFIATVNNEQNIIRWIENNIFGRDVLFLALNRLRVNYYNAVYGQDFTQFQKKINCLKARSQNNGQY